MSIQNLDRSVHSSMIHHSHKWKQLTCLSAEEWINKIQYIYTIEYYSAINNKNKIVIDVCYNMVDLENITLSEGSQTQKVTYRMIPFV